MRQTTRDTLFQSAFWAHGRFLSCLLLLWAAALNHTVAQTLDPAFHLPELYGEGQVFDAVQMPNGQYVVGGSFNRANGQANSNLARFDAAGADDQTFRQNLRGATVMINKLVPMANGQLLVQGNYKAGTVQRDNLFRLNADGTLDPTLNLLLPGISALTNLGQAIVQPDGHILIMGWYLSSNSLQSAEVLRVLSDGSRDASFRSALLTTSSPKKMLLQPDGKIVLAGFPALNGGNAPIVRLNGDGSLDTSFQSAIRLVGQQRIDCVALDATTGNLLVGGVFSVPPAASSPSLYRLLSTGALDPSFTAPVSLVGRYCNQVEVLPNGRILVLAAIYDANNIAYPFNNQLIELQPNGAIDASFLQGSGPDGYLTGVRTLANGNFLTWGSMNNYAGQRRTVAMVQPGGGLDANFAPLLQAPASVAKIVRQADGKLLIAGSFNAVDGHLTDRVARLLPNGQPDLTFTWRQPQSAEWETQALAGQADGRVLLASRSPNCLIRLNVDGTLDSGFVPVLTNNTTYTQPISLLFPLANGQIIVGGAFMDAAGKANLTRLNANGSVESTFVPPATLPAVGGGLVQADGAIVCIVRDVNATPYYQNKLVRLLATGTPDPAFNYVNTAGNSNIDEFGPTVVAQVPTTGGYVAGGIFNASRGSTRLMVGVTAIGDPLPGFAAPFQPFVTPANLESRINSLAVQSDGRILVGGTMQQSSQFFTPDNLLARLDATGRLDASFNISTLSVPVAIRASLGYFELPRVSAIVVQPDGAILAGGYFLQAAGQPVTSLAQFLPTGVLAVRDGKKNSRLQVWPVPAHDVLHLRLETNARPQRVSLLDALGKVVITQPTAEAELTLNTGSLAPGLYVLRVDYANGPATRRIVIE